MKRPTYNDHSRQNSPAGNQNRQGGFQSGSGGAQDRSEIDAIVNEIKGANNLSDIDIEEITKEDGIAERFVKALKGVKYEKPLKTTQLRKFFDTIVKIKEKSTSNGWEPVRSDFYMLRPNLAYAKGRDTISKGFYDFCTACLGKIEADDEDMTLKNYDRFVKLMESVVAYSKYYDKERY